MIALDHSLGQSHDNLLVLHQQKETMGGQLSSVKYNLEYQYKEGSSGSGQYTVVGQDLTESTASGNSVDYFFYHVDYGNVGQLEARFSWDFETKTLRSISLKGNKETSNRISQAKITYTQVDETEGGSYTQIGSGSQIFSTYYA